MTQCCAVHILKMHMYVDINFVYGICDENVAAGATE
jgi:hypothetical protein